MGLTVVPRRLSWPLRRLGVDPAPQLLHRVQTRPVSRLARVLGRTVWLVSGYEHARSVLADTASFSSDIRPLLGHSGVPSVGGLGFTDGPEHRRLRRLIAGQFTARRIAALEPAARQVVDDRLEAMAGAGPVVDLVSQFAFPVPFRMICDLLGVPEADRE